ncbi:Arm DNA-binding domain-containing protein [Agrobacterium tumefaciens]|uniref:Arm DNA-binding domain-containing protein n=1 Tax=Agrobacterium tumefaciens TaxID=358 RepID=UPI0034577CCF
MARSLQKLSDVLVKSTKLKAGRHSDGGGLYLNVTPAGSKSWLYMWTVDGKRREMGLGPYPSVTLANARSKASDARQAVAEGRDPIEELIALLDLLDGDENLEPYLAGTDPNDEDREDEDEREPEELEENGDEHECSRDEYVCSSWNGGARDAATFFGARCFTP